METLIKALKNDDRRAIDALFQQYYQKLYGFTLPLLKSEADAEDVVQDVFVKIWQKRTELKTSTNFDAFIFTIAKNTVFSKFRKLSSEKKYMDHLENVSVLNSNVNLDDTIDYHFLKERVDKVVSELPDRRREVFVKSREEGKTYKEIASELGISEKTVDDHMQKALKFIRSNLGKQSITAELFICMFYL